MIRLSCELLNLFLYFRVGDTNEDRRVKKWSKSGSLREFLSDYDRIISGERRTRSTERKVETAHYEETAYDSTRTRYRGGDPYSEVSLPRSRIPAQPPPQLPVAPPPPSASTTTPLPGESTVTTETTITTTTEIKRVSSKSNILDEHTDFNMPRVPTSPTSPAAPPLDSPPLKNGGVSALTQQFEMNAKRNWMETNGGGVRWSPKGGPKAKELPELSTGVEVKTTPTGGKYKKIDYEVVDTRQSETTKPAKKLDSPPPVAPKRYKAPINAGEQITVYEYEEKTEVVRPPDESINVGKAAAEYEKQRAMQDTLPRRKEWEESRTVESWSSSRVGGWPPPFEGAATATPPPSAAIKSDELEKPKELPPSWSTGRVPQKPPAPTHPSVVKQEQDWRIDVKTSDIWDTSSRSTYSSAPTLEKNKEMEEEEVKLTDEKKPLTTWTVVKSTRFDDNLPQESPKKYDEKEPSSGYSSRADSRMSKWETEVSSSTRTTERKSPTEMSSSRVPPKVSPKPPAPPPPPKTTTEFKTPSTTSGDRTTTTTTTEFKISNKGGMDQIPMADYHSSISARPGFARTAANNISAIPFGGMSSGGGRILKTVTEIGSSSMVSGSLSPFGQNAASTIRDTREREKKEMSDLNDRLASYIEKVRFLEAQNRKLAADLDLLRGRWGKDTNSVRSMYEGELQQARKVVDDTNQEREELEKQIRKLIEDLSEYRRRYEDAMRGHQIDRERIDELLSQLSALEAEINLLRRRITNLEEEVSRIKKENLHFVNELTKARSDLDQETLNRIDYQNQVQTLLEEIDFIRRVHDQEIGELQALASRDTTPENREYFKNELSSAIRDIRAEYDQIYNMNRTDMESWYKLKVQEIQTQSTRMNLEQGYAKEEVKRLRSQLGDLRGKLADLESRNSLLEKQMQELNYQLEDDQRSYEAALNDRDAQIRKMRDECQALMLELQMLLDTKQTLDAEIAIYRKMLEGEENRAGLRQLVEQVVKTHGLTQTDESESLRVLKGETASRTSFQRSAKGNVSIQEATPDGKYVILENTHTSKEEFIGEWILKRKIDGKREIVYRFPKNFVLMPRKTVKIWAHGQGGIHNPPEQLVFDNEDSFGSGSNVQTMLYDMNGVERATMIQRSSHVVS